MTRLLKPEIGRVQELTGHPLMGAVAARMFAGARFHRGMPRAKPQYRAIGDAYYLLDEQNQEHVRAALRDRAKRLGVPVSDLAWALSPQKVNGLHAVLVKKWEDIEREEFEARKG